MSQPEWSQRRDVGAIQFMVLDILSNLLTYTDNPKEMGAYLTKQIRELVGAKRVVLVQAPAIQGAPHRIVSVEPKQQWDAFPPPELDNLAHSSRSVERSTHWKRGEATPELNEILARMGIELLIANPLRVGKEWMGALFVVDPVEFSRVADDEDVLDVLSPVVALVLRNASLFEAQEEEIRSRTQALAQSETKFRMLTELAPVGIFRLDAEGNFHFANDWMRRMTGATGDIPDTEHWTQILRPEDRRVVEAGLGRTLATGEPFREEFRLLATSGGWVTVIGEAVAERDEAGAITGFIGTLTDISERKQAETALLESEREYHRLVWDMQVGVLLQGPQSEIRLSNPKALELLGLSEAQLLGKTSLDPAWNVIHEDGSPFPGSTHPVPQAITTRRSVREVVMGVYRPLTGDRVWLSVDAEPQLNDDGSLRQVVCTFIDITKRKLAEEERHRLEERMNQIQKLEALGVLVAGVAHNINNVLAAIMATASVRERRTTEPKDLEAYRIIDTACKRGRDVVKSLTQFARPTLSNQGSVNLHALITEVRVLLENTTGSRITIREVFSEEAMWIHGDAGSLNHALMNLCLNAMDAMPNGGTLTFRTTAVEPGAVDLAVVDTGEGMTSELQSRVMEPFFTTKPVGKGTGLGLSMTHGVIKAHGGTLALSSAPGQGTTVTLRIPRISAPVVEQPLEPAASPLKLLRVLLVDDDEDVRFLTTRMLKAAGLQVNSVASGEEALERLRSEAIPDLIILDQNMPRMNGIQTMEQIRVLLPDILILISSGQPDIEEWACFKQPNVAVISKPFEMEELLAKLARISKQSLRPASP